MKKYQIRKSIYSDVTTSWDGDSSQSTTEYGVVQTFDTRDQCEQYLKSQGFETSNDGTWRRLLWKQGDSCEILYMSIQEYNPDHVQAKRAKCLELEIKKGDLQKTINDLQHQIADIDKQLGGFRSDLKKYE